jgi:hypothetical protein
MASLEQGGAVEVILKKAVRRGLDDLRDCPQNP